GRERKVGEVSAAAEAFGVAPGMRVGEAIARCPGLRLVPPDPEGARTLWGAVLDRLERIGAEVESDTPGAAFFEADGLRRLHGGSLEGVLRAASRALSRQGSTPKPRLAAAPSRFCAHVAALHTRARRTPRIVPA